MLRTLAIALTATTALTVAVPLAHADELTKVYAQILANPTSVDLNLKYAQLAEARGEYRKALGAYERILVNDPANAAARDGLQRVRRVIQPPETQKIVELGAIWQSNVLRSPMATGDVLGYGSFRLRDERPGDKHRWRTNLNFYGEAYAQEQEMNYASIGGDIGPIVDIIGTNWAVRPSVGAGTAWLDGRSYYRDVNAAALFEGYLNGAYQWLRFRVGYRWYDESFTSDAGSYVDISGRFSLQDVFGERDSISIGPWVRWNNVAGVADNDPTDFAAGLYTEVGAKIEYSKRFNDAFAGSVGVKVSDRSYQDIGSGSRNDWNVAPGASLVFSNLLGPQADLRFDYKYEWNTSNLPEHTWQNQSITAAVVWRR
jgi:hypothetical protein